ncbi:DUF418 domain-containing protein [Namhaeicola litoreus]|uniref:DUF418 domain-containing protein n=1 Tax=Namhaeicola litoreus TaxID=1052145 RepID=A0ABW3XZZ0_9FLAO
MKNRLFVIDALRGFAIVAIMLLHNIEHFDYYFTPENLPNWLIILDKWLWEFLFFLFAGKAYAMFALLFGLTFYIQSHNQNKKGKDFGLRFAWRMLLLFAFGIVNSAFYQGDILTIYAVLGLFLIPINRLNDKAIFIISLVLFIQPLQWIELMYALNQPAIELTDPKSWTYFGKMGEYIPNGSFWETVEGNLSNGKKAVLLWNWENGRYFLILSLFVLGLWSGRRKIFVWEIKGADFWQKVLKISFSAFLPLYFGNKYFISSISSEAIKRPLNVIISSWSNTAFMFVLLASFILLFHNKRFHKTLDYFSSFGKMSLSNYIIQSIIGSTLYYGFGLGLYKYTGTLFAVGIALILVFFLGKFCKWWLTNHKRGPLETIWHNLTWLTKN